MSGDGSIYRRDDRTWVAQLSIGGRGSRKYVRRNARTKREAREALDELKAEHRAGVKRSRLTTGDFLEQWVRDVRTIRPATRQGYAAVIRTHLVPQIGHVRLYDLAPADVEALLTRLAPTMKPKTLRNLHAVLRRALTYAVRMGYVARNVAGRDYIDVPDAPPNEPEAFTREEVEALLATIRGERLEALFVTAVGTGLRQGELLGLSWQDIDLDGASVTVRYELARRDGGYVLTEPKTDRSRRTVPLAPEVVDALTAHRGRLILEGFTPVATGPVFVSPNGSPLNGSWLSHHFDRLTTAAGIRRLPFKNLRTTFGSRLFEAGVPSRRIADLMGHARERTTQRHYIDTSGAGTTEAVAAISGLLARESRRESRETVNGGVSPSEMVPSERESGSGGRIRTYDQAVNSVLLRWPK